MNPSNPANGATASNTTTQHDHRAMVADASNGEAAPTNPAPHAPLSAIPNWINPPVPPSPRPTMTVENDYIKISRLTPADYERWAAIENAFMELPGIPGAEDQNVRRIEDLQWMFVRICIRAGACTESTAWDQGMYSGRDFTWWEAQQMYRESPCLLLDPLVLYRLSSPASLLSGLMGGLTRSLTADTARENNLITADVPLYWEAFEDSFPVYIVLYPNVDSYNARKNQDFARFLASIPFVVVLVRKQNWDNGMVATIFLVALTPEHYTGY